MERFWDLKEEVAELDYLIDLARLANGEAACAVQYKMAAQAILGPNQSYLGGHFSEHADEEWGHYDLLNAALMQRGSKVDGTITNMLEDALPETEELTSFDSEYLRDFFERAEDNAIKAYQEFYDKIEDVDKDLADIINGIISDERDHKLDMTRMVSEDNSAEEVAEEEILEDEEAIEPAEEELLEEPAEVTELFDGEEVGEPVGEEIEEA